MNTEQKAVTAADDTAPKTESNDTNSSNEGKNVTAPPTTSAMVRYWYLVVIFLLVLAVAGTYFWKNLAVTRAKADMKQRAEQVISSQNSSYLRLVAIPLVWAVRSEMLRGNIEQVNQYIASFVKEQNMKELVIVKPDGIILAATNKKLEGASVTTAFPAEVMQAESTTISSRENGDILVASPIMGLNSKLGALLLVYSPVNFSLEPPVAGK